MRKGKVGFVSMKTWKAVKKWAVQARAGNWPEEGLLWGETASGGNGQKQQIRKGAHEAVRPCDETIRAPLPDKNKVSDDDHG